MIASFPSRSVPVQAIFIFLMAMLLAIPGDSFSNHASKKCRANNVTCRKTALQVISGLSNARPKKEGDAEESNSSFNRRSILLTGASVTAGFFIKENNRLNNNSPAILTTIQSSTETGEISNASTSATSTVSSVEEALKIIESMGDKRFLHAIVASDYQFLYEQSKTPPSDIDVEQIFSKKVAPSSNNRSGSVVLATTGTLAKKNANSLWPLEGNGTRSNVIHYAWPEQGGVLKSNKSNDDGSMTMTSTSTSTSTQTMIVDGIDCGKMSLEDALEGDMQVLVQAPTYLSVPSYMESALRKGLQGAFFI